MTSSVLDALDVAGLRGEQHPRILYVPPAYSLETGDEAVELSAMAGLDLDEWQQIFLRNMLAETDLGRWVSYEAAAVVPRQNGKGGIIEARELAGLFLLGERVLIHSAHLFDTAMEAMRRILELIESVPDFDRRVKRVSKSHGDEGIELMSGQRLRFKTRTAGGGRGLTGDFVCLDEAMILPTATVDALMPTMSARSIHGNPQLLYTGSAGNEDSIVLGRIRRRALAGGDPSLCYAEWSVDEAEYATDPESVAKDPRQWAIANPGMGIRISAEHIGREQRSMDPVGFARERLGIGTWPADDGDGAVFSSEVWSALTDPTSGCGSRVALAIDMPPDRSTTAISGAGQRTDGKYHIEVLDEQPGSAWVVAAVLAMKQSLTVLAVVLDPASPAGSLITDLEAAGIEVTTTGARDVAQSCGDLYDLVLEDSVRHHDDPALANAVRGATQRSVGSDGAWAWNRKDYTVNISRLVACTLALWGFKTKQGEVFDVTRSVW